MLSRGRGSEAVAVAEEEWALLGEMRGCRVAEGMQRCRRGRGCECVWVSWFEVKALGYLWEAPGGSDRKDLRQYRARFCVGQKIPLEKGLAAHSVFTYGKFRGRREHSVSYNRWNFLMYS